MIVGNIVKHCFYPDRPVGIIIELVRDDPKFFKIMWNDGAIDEAWGYDLEVIEEKRYLIDETR